MTMMTLWNGKRIRSQSRLILRSYRSDAPLAALLLPLLLAACGGSSPPVTAPLSDDAVGVPIPRGIAQLRAVDPSMLSVVVSVDGDAAEVTSNDDNTQWSSRFLVPSEVQADLLIEWSLDGLLLARHQQRIGPGKDQSTLSLSPEIYQTTGGGFDFDNDGASNLQELLDGTDPWMKEEGSVAPAVAETDVIIPRVANGPSINGQVGVIWENNPLVDTRGQMLAIDNLMIDRGARLADGATGFRWQAVHDGTRLYLLVYAEAGGNQTPNGDSTSFANDDVLHLFFDGDNSKGETYDGVDDRHLFIPLLELLAPQDPTLGATAVLDDAGNVVRNEDGDMVVEVDGEQMVVTAGGPMVNENIVTPGRRGSASNSAPVPGSLEFSSCLCAGSQQLYEVSVSLDELGISVGRPFGFELQLDDDVDGGNQDARYGWVHPSMTDGSSVNNTAVNPSFMGTVVLGE